MEKKAQKRVSKSKRRYPGPEVKDRGLFSADRSPEELAAAELAVDELVRIMARQLYREHVAEMEKQRAADQHTYPAVLEKCAGGFGVWFPDIDGCVTGGDTFEDAVANAREVLSFWLVDAKVVPKPSSQDSVLEKVGRDATVVLVSPSASDDKFENPL